MAVEHVTAVLHGLFGVDPTEKLIMLIIAEHARRGSNRAWPSIGTLARLGCLSRRQTQRIVHRLIDSDWLAVEISKGRRANNYVLNLDRLAANRVIGDTVATTANRVTHDTVTADPTVSSATANRVIRDANRVTHDAPTVSPMTPEPVLNRYNPTGFEPDAHARTHATDASNERSTAPFKKRLNGEPEHPTTNPSDPANRESPTTSRARNENETERIARLEGEKQRQVAAVRELMAAVRGTTE